MNDDLDDDYKSFYINEFRDKIYEKKRTDYQKPRVNSFATKAKEDKHKKNQSGYKEKKEHYKRNGGKRDKDKKPGTKEENCYSYKMCNEETHSILRGYPKFQRFIPEQPGGSECTPKEVCLMCLGTVYSNCLHKSLADYKRYFCKIGRRHFVSF